MAGKEQLLHERPCSRCARKQGTPSLQALAAKCVVTCLLGYSCLVVLSPLAFSRAAARCTPFVARHTPRAHPRLGCGRRHTPSRASAGEALVLQTAGYQAILHGHAGGYRSHVLVGGRWTVWHSTASQGTFPPLPHVAWQQGPTQAYYMSADPWPLAVLLHTVSAPNKRQEPGLVNPPALVWSPDQEEHLRAAWQGDAIRATDVPDLRAGPITHARPAATLAVA